MSVWGVLLNTPWNKDDMVHNHNYQYLWIYHIQEPFIIRCGYVDTKIVTTIMRERSAPDELVVFLNNSHDCLS